MKLSAWLGLAALLVAACGGANEQKEPAQTPAAPPQAAQKKRSEPPSTPPAFPPPSTPPPAPSHASESCGELAMTRVGLITSGKGENHSEVRGVDALLERCTDKTPPPEACKRTDNELTEQLARGYGENHPSIRSLRAKKALCP